MSRIVLPSTYPGSNNADRLCSPEADSSKFFFDWNWSDNYIHLNGKLGIIG